MGTEGGVNMAEGRIQSERRWRMEYAITTATMFPVGGLLYTGLAAKICLTILFIVPVYLAMLGVLYAIPYGIYNLLQIFRLKPLAEEERQIWQQVHQQRFGTEDEPW